MSRYRTPVFAIAILSAALWALSSCGDGTTEPPPDPPRPTTVTVTPAVAELTALDATVQLNAQVLDQYGQVMAGAAVAWSSGDASVAGVDGVGLVTAAGNGAVTVTATAGSVSGTAAVTVAQKVSAVEVSPAADTVVERDTVRFEAAAMDANGHGVAAAEFAWASSDTSVAVVDGVGLVSGVGAGEVEVTATSSGVAGSASLVVEAPVPTMVTVAPDTVAFTALGDTVRLMAEVRDQIGRVMEGEAVAWASGDTMVAVVDSAGLVGAVGNGAVTVTAAAGEASGEAAVTVAQNVSAVEVSPAADTVVERDTVRFEAAAMDANGHMVAEAEFAWSSSDTSVAVVDGAGLVTGVGLGQAEVTATAAGVTGRADLTVVAPAPTTIAVTPDTVALSALGETAQLAAEVRDQAGRVLTEADVSWSSGDTTVAEVDSAGLVTAVDVGEATITATSGEASGEAVVTVMQSAGSVVVSPAADTVALGDTLRLEAVAFDANGHVVAGAAFAWSSSDAPVARVDGSGLVRGVGEGTATITATAGVAQGTAEITVANPDRAVLVALYNATNGPNWLNNENWLTEAPLRNWYGVSTDASGRVVGVNLAGTWDSEINAIVPHGLSGPIPPELGSLATLTELNLLGNQLTGPIPAELGNLANLTWLYLGRNQLTGPIPPELGNLTNLKRVSLGPNALSGPIPPELGNLANLTYLSLVENDLSGPIPAELGNLGNLTELWLYQNQLSGPIPPELGNLHNLRRFHPWGNDLSGSIPPELGSLANLKDLGFSDNAFEGTIPSELGNLANLTELKLFNNNLSGLIPPELGNLASLTSLSLGGNQLTGPIPPELERLTNLVGFSVSNGNLTGPIPPELGNLTNLRGLYLRNNNLSGPLPQSLVELDRLEFLYIDGNELLCVPATSAFAMWLQGIDYYLSGSDCNAADLAVLHSLYEATGGANWNEADGWLDGSLLGEWYGVTADSLGLVAGIDLTGNGLAGHLPANLGALARMTELRIGDNSLSGRLPLSLAQTPLREFRYADTHLCAPGEPAFQAWLNAIPSHQGTGVQCTPLSDRNILAVLYEATGGPDWINSGNWLTGAPLEQWHGVHVDGQGRVVSLVLPGNNLQGAIPSELGSLTRLTTLELQHNNLTAIPPELGNLTNLTALSVGDNQLSGTIPPELGKLANLRSLRLDDNAFGTIPPELGDLANLAELSLRNNKLWGPIPPELGNLASLTVLELQQNHLTGPIAAELGNLANLIELFLYQNQFSGPIPPELGSLTNLRVLLLGDNELSGPIPPELGNLVNLTALGLQHNNLTAIPPELDKLASLRSLRLDNNALATIPPELGNLTNLTFLSLRDNDLAGTIPPELGNLTNLTALELQHNNLTAIPPELGGLTNLRVLRLSDNDLGGPIPPELGNLTNLTDLELQHNSLTTIPPELGDLANANLIRLNHNRLSGAIPSALGNLSTLEEFFLDNNDLSGPVPPQFEGMVSLRRLVLTNNPMMAGPLPVTLTALRRLEALMAGGTDLCAGSDPGFQTWLIGVSTLQVAPCTDPPMAYLIQAVQSRELPVPLVAGEQALLRVFLTTSRATGQGIPAIRARFYHDGRETDVIDVPGRSTPIPTVVKEGSLASSANAVIPGRVVRPGIEMVIDVDPDGTLDPALGVTKRIPETGRIAVDVRDMPLLDLTLIPFLWSADPDSLIMDHIEAMAADPANHELLSYTRTLLPVGALDVKAHEPVMTSTNNAGELYRETGAIRAIEGAAGHYMGMISGLSTGGVGGLAALGGRVTYVSGSGSIESTRYTIAHELGHNFSLLHAPCRATPGPDPLFPHANGSIGAWGYDFRGGGRLVHPFSRDLMAYCAPTWISDYHFTNALRFRLSDEASANRAFAATSTRSILLWGMVGSEGDPLLEPAFIVDAPASLPQSGGEYEITGRTAGGGEELFSLSFAMPVVADGDGSSSFAFVLPVRSGWAGALATITLSGPGGSVTLDGDSDLAMTILRNPRNGQVRGILRDLPGPGAAAAFAAGPGLEVLFSRGIPDAAAWRR